MFGHWHRDPECPYNDKHGSKDTATGNKVLAVVTEEFTEEFSENNDEIGYSDGARVFLSLAPSADCDEELHDEEGDE